MRRNKQGKRARLLLAKAAIVASASALTATTAIDDKHHIPKSKSQEPSAESIDKLHELRRLSRLVQNVDESNAWSADSLDIIESIEVDGDWMEERERRMDEKRSPTDEANEEIKDRSNLRRRALTSKKQSEAITDDQRRMLGRAVGMPRDHFPQRPHMGGKSNKSGKGSGSKSAGDKKYMVVGWPPAPAWPPAPVPAEQAPVVETELPVVKSMPAPPATHHVVHHVGGWTKWGDEDEHIPDMDNEMESEDEHPGWSHGWWESEDDEEECYEIDAVWLPSSGDIWNAGHDDRNLEEVGEEGRYVVARNAGKPSGRDQRELQWHYVHYDSWNDAKSGKTDSKGGKTDSKSGKSWGTTPMWHPEPYTHWAGNESDMLPSSSNNDAVTIVMVSPRDDWGWSKSGKAKSGKTKSGKACYIIKDDSDDVGEKYCGMDFEDASSTCGTKCDSDADCTGGATCFSGVTACAEGLKYCGMDFEDARDQCGTKCESDADCTGGASCFSGISTCPEGLNFCGADFEDASSQCALLCTSDADCSGGEACFGGVTSCERPTLSYCGADPQDAAAQCDILCTSDADCTGGESCHGVTSCSLPDEGLQYCGVDPEDAASQCAIKCTSDADCSSGETCFGGIPTCSEGDNYCGGDPDDASSQCADRCTSDADCPAGQSCFGGITDCESPTTPAPTGTTPAPTAAGIDCPAGCPDCSPDSPLPCPPRDLKRACDKHNDELFPPGDPREGQRVANFFDCYDKCKDSFCCIHDSSSKVFSPSCANEEGYENCELYYPCYIIWWKIHDTIGPGTYLRVEQDEPFYADLDFAFLEQDFATDEEFFNQLFNHHFDTDDPLTDDTFENPDNW